MDGFPQLYRFDADRLLSGRLDNVVDPPVTDEEKLEVLQAVRLITGGQVSWPTIAREIGGEETQTKAELLGSVVAALCGSEPVDERERIDA